MVEQEEGSRAVEEEEGNYKGTPQIYNSISLLRTHPT